MRLVGIDLSTKPSNCGICVLEGSTVAHVGKGKAKAQYPDWLIKHCTEADVVAIDVPFGWPEPFVKALCSYRVGIALERDRKPYLRRTTDAWIVNDLPKCLHRDNPPPNPFAVAADKLGSTAMVGTLLLNALLREFWLSPRESQVSKSVIEVYPAVSLWAWGLAYRGFKGNDDEAKNKRAESVAELQREFNLVIDEGCRSRFVNNDHCFDALVAALTAQEYAEGNTFDPPGNVSGETLEIEGWIRVPNRNL